MALNTSSEMLPSYYVRGNGAFLHELRVGKLFQTSFCSKNARFSACISFRAES